MCKAGDIIVVEDYQDNGKSLTRHSFVVISNQGGKIQGMAYDMICNVMSSFKSPEQRGKKLSYPGNLEFTVADEKLEEGNTKTGYIKAEQFYYFIKAKLNYKVIGTLTEDFFNALLEYIEGLEIGITEIVDNL